MNNYFLEQMNNCVDEFYKFYNIDEYISKNKYEKFIDKYKDIFNLLNRYENKNEDIYQKMISISQNGYKMIEKKNDIFLQRHLESDKEYFDKIFLEIDPSIKLDEEQRKAILIDEDYSLIVAGAGSGKTTTMAAKVKYLIEKKKVNSKDIILLSFTNRATEELNHLLNEQFSLNIEVLTFHKLGNKFIRNILNAKPEIISDNGIYKVLSQYFVENVFTDKNKLKQYIECFDEFLFLNDSALDFTNYEDYYKNYTNLKYDECKDFLDKEIKRRIANRIKHRKTINGEYVKSESEVKIANYLYKNGISYKYEDLYPYKLANGGTYKPDFTIDNFDEKIYVEYYGFTKLNNDNSIISETVEYQNNIFLKRKTHSKYATNYIELFGRYENGDYYLPKLSYELGKYNIIKKSKSDKEIFYRLMETSKDSAYFKLINFISKFISLFKELGYNKNDFEYFINSTQDESLKKQLLLLEDAFDYYQKSIHEIIDGKIKIDFQDMIHYAYSRMEKLKATEKFQYKYVIIDEYQDISVQRWNFAKKISELFNSKIVAVGYDQVIILNGLNLYKGFPSQIKDHPVVKLIKGATANVEENYIEYPEERRLFYVALTRTKNKVYILIPNSYEMRSDFVKEIENQNNVIVSSAIV